MKFFDLFGQDHESSEEDNQHVNDMIAAQQSPELEVFPLHDIPVTMEDAPIHDGINPCHDISCPCQNYGYGGL